MKCMTWIIACVVMTGVVLAQQDSAAGTPAAGAASMTAPPSVPPPSPVLPPGSPVATNAVAGKPDPAKAQAMLAEFSSISRELSQQEVKLLANDDELKALVEKQEAAKQIGIELIKQQRDLLDKKLSEDPELAPKVAKRRELQQALKDLRRSMGLQNPGIVGPHARLQPPPTTPPPAPMVVPDADKPAAK